MKTRFAKVCRWVGSSALLAGLLYSVLALTVTTPVARASSCSDCSESQFDAATICSMTGAVLTSFTCPYGVNQDEFRFKCSDHPNQFYTLQCAFN
jgi:hypothetical protein